MITTLKAGESARPRTNSSLEVELLTTDVLGRVRVPEGKREAILDAFERSGQTRLDNNAIENAIRPTALGKKNWLFIGHPQAGQRSAIIYSIVVSCRRHGKDPHAYLRDVLSRLPRMTNQNDLGPLTPARWQPPATTTPS